MADDSTRGFDHSNNFGTDAEPELSSRTTENSKKLPRQGSSQVNIQTAKYVGFDSTFNIPKKISKEKKGFKALGIFWDFQNCPVPSGKSVLQLISNIKNTFVTSEYSLKEFICVLDTTKESIMTIDDLNRGKVKVQHVSADSKNAADEKIKNNMIQFADLNPEGSKVVLISSDKDYGDVLSTIKNTKKMEVILVHEKADEALQSHVSEHILYKTFTEGLPDRDGYVVDTDIVLVVTGYKFSQKVTRELVKGELEGLISQWNGNVVKCEGKFAIVKVANKESAKDMITRLKNEKVCEQPVNFKLLEDSEHKDTIKSMMDKNKKGGECSKTKKVAPPPQNPKDKKQTSSRQPEDVSTDREGQQLQLSLEQTAALCNILKNTTGQCKLQHSGIFWDMETCPLPTNSTVKDVVDSIRHTCVDENYYESEFICFYNVLQSGHTLGQLQESKITTVHTFTDATEVIRNRLMKFAELIPPGSRVILITNNADLLHLLDHNKNVKKFQIILIHDNIDKPALDRFVSKCLTLEEIITKDDAASADNA